LLDAPCSATGTLRRHPDLPHLKQEGDIAGFAQNQRRLLAAALTIVKPGGTVVYSVCSLEPEEGPDVVGSVLKAHGNVARIPITAAMIGAPDLVNDRGELRTLPSHWAEQGGMDGFYAALLRRGA
jgi:16S rRNA (cytosine967-C5)-methyltransferase